MRVTRMLLRIKLERLCLDKAHRLHIGKLLAVFERGTMEMVRGRDTHFGEIKERVSYEIIKQGI